MRDIQFWLFASAVSSAIGWLRLYPLWEANDNDIEDRRPLLRFFMWLGIISLTIAVLIQIWTLAI